MNNNLKSVLSTLSKEYEKSIVDVNEAGVLKHIISESPNLNYILGGGIPRGRIITLLGPESGGKSSVATYIAGQIQKQKDIPNVIVYIDMEYTFEKSYAEVVGLDTSSDKFIFVRPKNGEEAFEIMRKLGDTGEIGGFVFDSVATISSVKALGKKTGEANFGATASVLSDGLKLINPILSRNNVTTIFVNQVRAKIGNTMGYGPQENNKVGGWALPFYSSWIGRVSGTEDILNGKELLGRIIKVRGIKSKIGIPKRQAVFSLNYTSGFNSDNEYIDFIVNLEYVTKSHAWFINDDWGMKVQGKANLLNFLKGKPDLFLELKDRINKSFYSSVSLDSFLDDEPESIDLEAMVEEAMEEEE